MNVILFGATGMVGQSALRESLLDNRVEKVVAVGRTSVPQSHRKLQQFELPDVTDLNSIEADIAQCDPWFKRLSIVITTEQLGKAMIELADRGYANSIIENHEIKQISQSR